jgi:hypothetical protein
MQFIRVRHSGEVFYFTEALASRGDVDIIEGPDTATPDTVLLALRQAEAKMAAEAEAAAAEAHREAGLRVAARSKQTKVVQAPAGLTPVVKADGDGDER